VAETKQTKIITMPTPIVRDNGDEPTPVPLELLEKKPVSEEMLSKTFVLMETPMLIVRKGKNLGQSFSLNRAFPVSIGRSRVNEIRLDDITISAQHCRIIPENGKHILCDLNSTNGTFLNEKKVSRQMLKEGDTIRVGETQFLYKIEQSRSWDATERI
jgi:pSer/pThr/pTyr-binding forkhead associated (FHA) protein